MKKITFKTKTWTIGGSNVITIPKNYVKFGDLNTEKTLIITIEQTEED